METMKWENILKQIITTTKKRKGKKDSYYGQTDI